ncbi:MAG: hypothetical protein ACM3UU_06975 [Ignavibacteriales bacterium]
MLNQGFLTELNEYIQKNLNKLRFVECQSIRYSLKRTLSKSAPNIELEDYIENNRQPTFNKVLFSFIDEKSAKDSDIYNKAGIDRRHFSKIRSNPKYKVGKNTAVALALALELDKKGTDKLLKSAGYSLSDSDTFDLVILFCLDKGVYDINDVNQALDYFSLKPLGGALE